jgi:hypothetical protein
VKRLPSGTQTSRFGLTVLMSFALLWACDRSKDGETVNLADLLPPQIGSFERQADADTYNRETIFDYIDGAGEVYNSYAFREVATGLYGKEGGPRITLELFDMGTPDDAYGVFSYGREQEETGVGGGYELRGSVLSFWQNRFYVCLTLEESDESSSGLLLTAAKEVSQRLPEPTPKPALVDMLPLDGLVPHSDRYGHRHQTLNYHYYLVRENVLHLDSTTNLALARYQPAPTLLLLVEYLDEAKASSAANSFRQTILSGATDAEPRARSNGKFTSCDQVGRYLVVILEAPSIDAARSLGSLARKRCVESLSQGSRS